MKDAASVRDEKDFEVDSEIAEDKINMLASGEDLQLFALVVEWRPWNDYRIRYNSLGFLSLLLDVLPEVEAIVDVLELLEVLQCSRVVHHEEPAKNVKMNCYYQKAIQICTRANAFTCSFFIGVTSILHRFIMGLALPRRC